MKKNYSIVFGIFVAIFMSFSFTLSVDASVLDSFTNGVLPAVNDSCDTLLGDPSKSTDPAYWLSMALNAIKYLAIIALLLLVTVDFFKALVSDDKDALKKASKNAVKRFIYCVILFFLPSLIDFVMGLFGVYGTCGLGE